MKSQNKKISGIKDIALKANVSIGTVDRVLHNRGEVSEATKEKVLKIVEELEYTPNILAQSLASKKKYTIAVLIPDYKFDNPYWEKSLNGIRKAAVEVRNYNFEIVYFLYELGNEESVTLKAKEIFNLKPDGLIYAPLMYEVSTKVICRCDELFIPYIFIDVTIENCKNLAYFGLDPVQSGLVAARLLDFGLPEKADIHIIKLVNKSISSYQLDLRERGFSSYFSTNGRINMHKIVSTEINISSIVSFEKALSKIIAPSESPRALFVPNSRVYHVAKYLYDSKQENNILIGYDLIEENVDYLNKGIIHFLISQNPEEQGYNSVMAFLNYLTFKKPLRKLNLSPIDIIVKENIDCYKNKNRIL